MTTKKLKAVRLYTTEEMLKWNRGRLKKARERVLLAAKRWHKHWKDGSLNEEHDLPLVKAIDSLIKLESK